MSVPKLRVVKLGGSSLESSDFVERFFALYHTLPSARTLLLVGGGPPVDAIRQMASLRAYDQVFLHWLCIDAMDISYRCIQQQWIGRDGWISIRHAVELQAWIDDSQPESALVHVDAFYTRTNHSQLPLRLPIGWETTSDSLAALLAQIVVADELILIKSCHVAEPYDWRALGAAGIVDIAFADAVRNVKSVRCLYMS